MTTAASKEYMFAREKPDQIFRDAIPLFEMHHEEISEWPEMPLRIDFKSYRLLDENGMLRAFTVREEGKLIGYCVMHLHSHLRHEDVKVATSDCFFLLPEFRGCKLATGFLAWCDEQLKLESVQLVYHHVRTTNDFSPLLKRHGYELVDFLFSKRL